MLQVREGRWLLIFLWPKHIPNLPSHSSICSSLNFAAFQMRSYIQTEVYISMCTEGSLRERWGVLGNCTLSLLLSDHRRAVRFQNSRRRSQVLYNTVLGLHPLLGLWSEEGLRCLRPGEAKKNLHLLPLCYQGCFVCLFQMGVEFLTCTILRYQPLFRCVFPIPCSPCVFDPQNHLKCCDFMIRQVWETCCKILAWSDRPIS